MRAQCYIAADTIGEIREVEKDDEAADDKDYDEFEDDDDDDNDNDKYRQKGKDKPDKPEQVITTKTGRKINLNNIDLEGLAALRDEL